MTTKLNTTFMFVEPDRIPKVWGAVRPYLVEQYKNILIEDVHDVYHSLVNGDYTLWLAFEDGCEEPCAGIITYLQSYSAGMFFCIGAAFSFDGKRYPTKDAYTFFKDVGKSLDCVGYEVIGREGWERKFPDMIKQGVVLRAIYE